jgi:hypothetical protein
MQEFAAPAIAGSIEVWKLLASDDQWRRQPTVHTDLYKQIRTWYELLVLNKDPTTDIRPYQLIRNWRATGRAIVAFLPQLLSAVAGTAGLFLVLFVFKSSQLKTIVGALSALGISTAGLTARLQSQAQALRTRLRQDIYTDLIAVAITTAPPPQTETSRTGRMMVETTVRKRTLTPTTPLS